MLKWNDKYSVGISIIDDQHIKFIDILNMVIYAKEHNDNPERLREALYRIAKYALDHFKTEETYMKEFDYPEYQDHKEEHSGFSKKVIAYCNRANEGDFQIANEILEYLKQWLVDHIQSIDRKYVDCFKRNGLK